MKAVKKRGKQLVKKFLHIFCVAAIFVASNCSFETLPHAQAGGSPLKGEVPSVSGSWTGDADANSSSGGIISLDLRQVDLRDALSALAIQMGKNVILMGDELETVDFKAKNLTAREAMELIIQREGLSYVEHGNTIIVGAPQALDVNFYNQMILTRFETEQVSAEKIKALIEELAIPLKNIIVEENPYVVFVQGTIPALEKVSELINNVDTKENRILLEYKALDLYLISPERAVELLAKAGIELEKYVALDNRLLVFDREVCNRWEDIENLFQNLDSLSAREEKVVTFKLKNVFAAYAAEKLQQFYFGEEIKTLTLDDAKFSRELQVVCPPGLESQVRSAVVSIDKEQERIKVPLLTATSSGGSSEEGGSSSANVHQNMHSRRFLLSELTGVPVSNMHISSNLSGDSDNPEYVLWVEETPDNVLLLRDMVEALEWGSE